MVKVQEFVGLDVLIKEENFQFNKDRGQFCLNFGTESADSCSISPSSVGHESELKFSTQVAQKIEKLFKPFDDYLAKMIGQEPFNWPYGKD